MPQTCFHAGIDAFEHLFKVYARIIYFQNQYYLIFPRINMEARRRHILGEIDQLEELLQTIIEMIPQISNEIDELQHMDLDPLLLELRLARVRALRTFVFFNAHTAVHDISLLMDYFRTL